MKVFASLLLISFLFFLISYSVTHSYFTDTAASQSNIFAAAETFPTSAITPTDTEPSPTGIQINPGDVVINELNWAGSDLTGLTGQNDEWIELKNMTTNSINLAGWKISGAVTGSGDLNILSGTIPANSFFLISNFDETISRVNISPDLIITDLQLDNSNAQYMLKDYDDNVIDTADDGSGNPLAGTNGPQKSSMERIDPPGNGVDGASWKNSTLHTNMDGNSETDEFGTPKAENGL